MAGLPSYSYPGYGAMAREALHYTQAIRVGDRVICSGQGGWDPAQPDMDTAGVRFPADIAAEVDQAFRNVDMNLRFAGGKGWSQVYKVLTLSTSIPEQHDAIVRNLKAWMADHAATWTEAGVSHLGAEGMRFEIEVEAYDPEGAAHEAKKTGKA